VRVSTADVSAGPDAGDRSGRRLGCCLAVRAGVADLRDDGGESHHHDEQQA
jgi:hypothetical protein